MKEEKSLAEMITGTLEIHTQLIEKIIDVVGLSTQNIDLLIKRVDCLEGKK